MRPIARVFLDNFARLRGNVIAIVIVCGLVILPSLYAWFSLLAFWDPEGSTGNLSVAVASDDEGYQSDFLPTRLDAGSLVVTELRANDQFHWVFVDSQAAVDGVRSGAYYAAVVIPKDFSQRLMSIFSGDAERPVIDYYVNDKVNPIAPHLTSIGASTLQADIDAAFTQVVAGIALNTGSSVTDFVGGETFESYVRTLVRHLETAVDQVKVAEDEVRALADLVTQTRALVVTSSKELATIHDFAAKVEGLVADTRTGLTDTKTASEGLAAQAQSAIDAAKAALEAVKKPADDATAALENVPSELKPQAKALQDDIAVLTKACQDARAVVQAINPAGSTLASLDNALASLASLSEDVDAVTAALDADASELAEASGKVSDSLASVEEALSSAQTSAASDLQERASALYADLESLGSDAEDAAAKLSATADTLSSATVPLEDALDAAKTSLDDGADLLQAAVSSLSESHDALSAALQSNDVAEVRRIIGNNPDALARELSAPTAVNKHAVYAMANYGSAMSPFYTSLALFIGAIFLVIILQVSLSPERRLALGNPKPSQEYVGNLLFFLLIGLAQAVLLCTGNVFYLGVQCQNVALYYLTGLTCSFVFVNIAFACTVAFGDVGKALVVILLVMQVAGSGGELPITLSAPIFQAVYPWLPFTHSMNLFQGAMAGIYGNQFIVSYLCLLAFTVPALALGLVFRYPIMRLNDWVNAQLEKTGVL